MSQSASASLAAARDAFPRHEWTRGLELFKQADRAGSSSTMQSPYASLYILSP